MTKRSEPYDMNFADLSAILAWIAGVVVAKSGWATFFAIVFPPWAYYLLIQHLFMLAGAL